MPPTPSAPDDLLALLGQQVLDLAGTERARLPPSSLLARAASDVAVLRLTAALLQSKPVDTHACLESENALVQAAVTALCMGASPKMVGTQLAAALCAETPGERLRVIQLMHDGCALSYEGPTIAVALRQARHATATFNNGTRYIGSWLAGRMHGNGCIETLHGHALYRGAFADNRPNGDGKMMDEQGRVLYAGGFRDGKYHGTGTFHHAETGVTREGGWIDGCLCCVSGGRVKHAPAADSTVTTHTGGFWFDKPHGMGVEHVVAGARLPDSSSATTAKFSGTFHLGKKHGVGILYTFHGTTPTGGVLGIWWNDELKHALAKVDPHDTLDSVLASAPAVEAVSMGGLPKHRPCPTPLPAARRDAGVQTDGGGSHQLGPVPALAAVQPRPTKGAALLAVSVMSISTQTNMPRREFVAHANAPAARLLAHVHTPVPFVAGGALLDLEDERPLADVLQPVAGAAAGPGGAAFPPIFFVQCPACLQPGHMSVLHTRGDSPASPANATSFLVFACTACGTGATDGDPVSTLVVYCRTCARRNPRCPLSFMPYAQFARHTLQFHPADPSALVEIEDRIHIKTVT